MAEQVIPRLYKVQEEEIAAIETIVAMAADENRDLSDVEEQQVGDLKLSIEKRGAKIAELEKAAEERKVAEQARAKFNETLKPHAELTPGRPEPIYKPAFSGDGHSFFQDVYAAHKGDFNAMRRLSEHNQYMVNLRPEYRSWAGGVAETRDGTSGSTSYGSFIPPVWLLDEIAEKARTGRVVPNMVRDAGAPTSTSITIPRVTTGSATAIQASENAAVQETDIVTAQLTRTTSTIGGIQDVSIQSVELSPMAVDRFIFGDLIADYNRALDSQTIIGSGAGGQLLGLDSLSGVNAVTYTDATPTVPELYSKLADAVQQVHTNRFAPPDAVLMHPRRWAWILAASDSSNRPLVAPVTPMNAPGDFNRPLSSFGPVGSLQGLPVYTDANIPTNLGAGTNEDEVYVGRFNDMLLMEGPLRTEVFPDVGSANLTVRFRVYAFVNFFAGRFPAGVSRITGTGLIAPTF